MAQAHTVTLIDIGGQQTDVPIPRRIARKMGVAELFDTANAVAEWLEDRPINARKATEQDVADFLRWHL